MEDAPELEFRKMNHVIIQAFLEHSNRADDDIGGSIKATLAQFLLNVRQQLNERANQEECVSYYDIVDSQIVELRRCIVDLEECKTRILQGVTKQ